MTPIVFYEYCRAFILCLDRAAPELYFRGMDHKQPRKTAPTQNRAQDKKRADALRQNLLKRKQQTKARTDKEDK